ncbi:hypothetical protein, partial [Frankia nepalensis]|uniref:hypothetical protein n=1 Tax=Frankia nepalensis TaxID=1836974 RepID=UPI001EE4ABA7
MSEKRVSKVRSAGPRGAPRRRAPPGPPGLRGDRPGAATPRAEAIGASREHSQLAAISAVMTAANQ